MTTARAQTQTTRSQVRRANLKTTASLTRVKISSIFIIVTIREWWLDLQYASTLHWILCHKVATRSDFSYPGWYAFQSQAFVLLPSQYHVFMFLRVSGESNKVTMPGFDRAVNKSTATERSRNSFIPYLYDLKDIFREYSTMGCFPKIQL